MNDIIELAQDYKKKGFRVVVEFPAREYWKIAVMVTGVAIACLLAYFLIRGTFKD